MNRAERRKELEAKGCVVFDDAADWLGMDEVERQRLDLHMQMGNTVRRLRARAGLTQTTLAKRLGLSRPRITDIELGTASLDLAIRALFGLGGTLKSLDEFGHPLTEAEKVGRVQPTTRKRRAASKA